MDGADTRWPTAGGGGLSLVGGFEDTVHDELTELFIGPADGDALEAPAADDDDHSERGADRAGRADRKAGPARVEALLIGNLPVRASLWVRQYAARLATSCGGAVGAIRLGRDGATTERHGRADSGFAWWVVRVDEVDQPALLRACGQADGSSGVDRITVLTGADDASVIACYRLLKSVAADLDRRLGEGEGPELAVSIAGSDEARSAEAVRRLRDASQRFLGRDLIKGPSVPRAGVTDAEPIGRWQDATGVADLLATIRKGAKPTPPPTPQRRPHVPRVRPAKPVLDEPTEAPRPKPVSKPLPAFDGPEPVLELPPIEPKSAFRGVAPPVSELIEGLTPVDLACPCSPEVGFATDAGGGLHAITRFGREGLDAAMSAAGWAKANASLLCRAEPTIDLGLLEHGCVVHVCGSDARELRSLGESDVQTHLLRRVETPSGDVWVCDPLN